MLSKFPKPYDDELLYSLISRYHRQSGNIETKASLFELFGEERIYLSSDFPTNLNVLFERLKIFTYIEPLDFLKEHTPFFYYTNFLSPEIKETIFNKVLFMRTNIHSSTGQMASIVKDHTFFKFCVLCAQEDSQQFGETFWRVSHQLPSVLVCTKHGTILKESNIRYRGGEVCQLNFATTDNQTGARDILQDISLTPKEHNVMKIVALQSELLLKERFNQGEDYFTRAYAHLLKSNGYISLKGNVFQKELRADFISDFGEKLLKVFQSYPSNSDSNWLKGITRTHRKSFHPLRHLLLLLYLKTTIQDFFNLEIIESSVFPFGPYKCLNKYCSHFMKNVIKIIYVKACTDTRVPIGEFRCSTCGFTYTRSGPDYTDSVNYSIRSVKEYGWLWKQTLVEFIEKRKLSYRATAREMNIDVKTVIKYYRLEKNSAESLLVDKEDEDKIKWLAMITNNPHFSKNELRKMEPALFARLYRKDKDWLKKTLPNSNVKVINKRINWEERDKETLKLIKDYILQNKNELSTSRITVSFIGAKINLRSLLHKKLDKMPLCACFLKCLNEDFFEVKVKKGKADL